MAPLVFRAPCGVLAGRAALCTRGRRSFCLLFVAPTDLRSPRGLPARPRVVRAASFARRVASKPGQAPPLPTGTAAWPSGPSGALHTGGAVSLMCALRVDSLSGQAPPLPINFARNSPAACSNIEFASLELQRFRMVLKSDHDKLCATFGQRGLCCRLRVLGSDSPAIPALVIPEAVGVLHYTKPAGGVSPACRTLV